MKQSLTICLLLLFCYNRLSAQKSGIEKMAVIAEVKLTPGWYEFNKGITVSSNTFNTQLHTYGVISNDLNLEKLRAESDGLNNNTTWYRQVYKNYPVEFGELVLHENSYRSPLAVGEFAFGLSAIPGVKISFDNALSVAQQRHPSKSYGWQIKEEEAALKFRTKGKMTSYYPPKKIVWLSTRLTENKQFVTGNYLLAYKITLTAFNPDFTVDVYVDATSGHILKSVNRECTFDVNFTSNFNGTQTAVTKFVGTTGGVMYNNFQMIRELDGLNDIYTSNNSNFYTPISNTTNTWDDDIFNNSAFTSQWAAFKVQDYYKQVHQRSGFDGTGFFMIDHRQNSAFVNNGVTYFANASFNATGIMRIGNNESAGIGSNVYAQDDWNSLDIIAHEFTHGVTFSTAELVYERESGALNESFSDILGASCYAWFKGFFYSNTVWLVGYDRRQTDNHALSAYIRNMGDPGEKNQPDTYGGANWIDVTLPDDPGDKWGVHRNSGVQNFMYYLLVNGGSGTNDLGTAYNVPAIGIIKARAIAYKALTGGYLTSSSGHVQSRAAWIRCAEDLYGVCSAEAVAVARAWYAVGLNRPAGGNTFAFCGNYGPIAYQLAKNGVITVAQNCVANVIPSSLIQLSAGNAIVMYPGFTAISGSNFKAEIVSACSETYY